MGGINVGEFQEMGAKARVVLQAVDGNECHLLGLTRKPKMSHEKSERLNTLFYPEIAESKASVFGRSIDD